MKVVLLGHLVDPGQNVSKDEVVSALLQGLREYRQDSRTEQVHGFAGEPRGIIICNVETAQELHEYMTLNPMAEFIEWEAHNSLSVDENISALEKQVKHLKAQKRAA